MCLHCTRLYKVEEIAPSGAIMSDILLHDILVQIFTHQGGGYPSEIYLPKQKSTHIWHLTVVNFGPWKTPIFLPPLFSFPLSSLNYWEHWVKIGFWYHCNSPDPGQLICPFCYWFISQASPPALLSAEPSLLYKHKWMLCLNKIFLCNCYMDSMRPVNSHDAQFFVSSALVLMYWNE